MTIKITTSFGDVTESIEFSTFDEYAAYVGMQRILAAIESTETPEQADSMTLAAAKKEGKIH